MPIPIIVEFKDKDSVNGNLLTKRGIIITGASDILPLLYATATKQQVLSLSEEPEIKIISLSAEIKPI